MYERLSLHDDRSIIEDVLLACCVICEVSFSCDAMHGDNRSDHDIAGSIILITVGESNLYMHMPTRALLTTIVSSGVEASQTFQHRGLQGANWARCAYKAPSAAINSRIFPSPLLPR